MLSHWVIVTTEKKKKRKNKNKQVPASAEAISLLSLSPSPTFALRILFFIFSCTTAFVGFAIAHIIPFFGFQGD